ncbi:hypothetical protein Nizo2494_2139 [Lactiplantibacillus plantarum]|uniref:Uncharacterized protein n=2 Tax=Lactiplantibacillus plantarum TaxID=1590 RepID=A0AB34Y6N1_LACPN|nr:hypothetical protein WJL_0694 [Lactiplantibacillus plantarum WJL]KZU04556.1 hypothetical protein Nizo2260_1489 [Lactiplantibacillus plantarum]KZU11132.1 hypothetical protein Nizo2457_3137 [Lactiplantibacillus plantarum]KZU25689.1 hypothetical protein Nizo2494_2139 [Lactiplantibacillus plantarum]OAP52922.1 hypothetical protein Nizo1837_0930 [Lactiplantibacillus plantarum]
MSFQLEYVNFLIVFRLITELSQNYQKYVSILLFKVNLVMQPTPRVKWPVTVRALPLMIPINRHSITTSTTHHG